MKSFTLAQLAERTGARLAGDKTATITGISALEEATADDASFLSNARYAAALATTHAGVVCVLPNAPQVEGKNYLISDNPSQTFQAITELFITSEGSGFKGVHPTAIVHPTAKIGKDVSIGPYSVIDARTTIGDRTQIHAHVTISYDVTIGADCTFYPQSVVRERCTIGDRVILQPGAVIGSCGFGYLTDSQGQHTKLEQLGSVALEADVEVGACTTIDRARFKQTLVKRGTKIDNLVQIGHNVQLGEHNIVVSQTGIAGSTKTGRNVVFAGQVGVVGHIEICDFAIFASRCGVSKSVTKPGKFSGSPMLPLTEYNRQQVQLRQISSVFERLDALEQKK
jgi:UDP-3-O-[3-hydroxymyristoyl] glucosamine N-acyltransferase